MNIHAIDWEACDLKKDAPFAIQGVSTSQLSVDRHYGACNLNVYRYTYFRDSDQLIRDDVLKWHAKREKEAAKKRQAASAAAQSEMAL